MNKTELAILGPGIKRATSNRHLWWELKRQIWDGGHQSYYPRQGEYDTPVRRALERLDDESVMRLIVEWQKVNRSSEPTREKVLAHYEAVMIEEIVKRAAVAAYRTIHW